MARRLVLRERREREAREGERKTPDEAEEAGASLQPQSQLKPLSVGCLQHCWCWRQLRWQAFYGADGIV